MTWASDTTQDVYTAFVSICNLYTDLVLSQHTTENTEQTIAISGDGLHC
jgi:hypothetical protein